MSLVGRSVGTIRIEAPLGRGGMGEVYQGFDTKLERLVALKTIRGGRRLDERSRAWFLREARHLSKLDHPNICRIYDLVQGQDLPDGEDLDFLVLELVEGRTLAELDTPNLPWERRLEVVAGIAAALAAAHERGIIHRDLKPANVMLTETGEVKVLDFGISRSLQEPLGPRDSSAGLSASGGPETLDGTQTLRSGAAPRAVISEAMTPEVTVPGSVVGTLRYMSPEQARGESVTASADLYSFGVLVQELLTGEAAYGPGEPGVETDDLQERVRAGETAIPEGLPAPWRSFVQTLTLPRAEERPSAAEAQGQIQWLRRAPQRRHRRRRWTAGALVVVALLTAAVAGTRLLSKPKALLQPGETARIALMPFVNATGDPSNDWFRLGLRELVAATLGSAREAQILPLKDVIQMVEGLEISDPGSPSPEALRRLGEALGSDLVIATEISGERGSYRLRYSVFDTAGSLGVRRLEAEEPTQGAQDLAVRLARRLRPEAVVTDLREAFTEDPYLNRTYALGVDALETEGGQAAEAYFRVCLDRQPDFSRAALRLASALRVQGQWVPSQEEVEAVLHRAQQAGDPALEIEAASILGTLLVDQGELEAAVGRYRATLALSREVGDRAGEAEALRGLGIVNYFTADYTPARQRLEEALEIRRALGDRRAEMRLLSNLGAVADGSGEDEKALAYDLQALAMARDLGDRHSEADFVGNLGVSYLFVGDSETAESYLQQSLDLAEALGDLQAAASAVHNLGLAAQHGERWEMALERFEDARQRFADLGDVAHRARSSLGIAKVLLDRGTDLKPFLDRLGVLLEEVEPWQGETADALHVKARLAYERGDRAVAVALQEQALRVGEPWNGRGAEQLERYRRAAGRRRAS